MKNQGFERTHPYAFGAVGASRFQYFYPRLLQLNGVFRTYPDAAAAEIAGILYYFDQQHGRPFGKSKGESRQFELREKRRARTIGARPRRVYAGISA